MAAPTKFWVVYSKATGRIRSIVRGETAEEESNITVKLNSGEAVRTLPIASYGNHVAVQPMLTSMVGISPLNDRYALVDSNGIVQGAIIADPLCGDSVPGFTLIAHPTAEKGWIYNSATSIFSAPVKVVV